uniref:Uncharacterized protein LOC104223022 n=1 Tax=Nicotiana sylvestris TaxID=4096 RepID=A0A1U7W237_NICSY|nr:PREDICTED: uncharacterized protein LOC104223022 [Nicotiana sylvestris]
MANKMKLTEFETVTLTEECTSRIQHKLPQKLKDPGSFTIPVRIGEIDVGRALCDLAASINLMLLLMFKQLGFGAPGPTMMMLQLAARSYIYPEGVIEDVLLQIGKFIFPAYFIIVDYEADMLVPIILGRPLLATGDSILKVWEGKMILRVDNEEAVFNVYRDIQLPRHYEDLSMISVVEINKPVVDPSAFIDDALEKALMLFNHLELEEEEEKLLRVLREHKHAIGWTMSDIKIVVASEDQEKTTFTCPYGTYVFKRMLFGLCNAHATFQRCMMAIFTDMLELFVDVFMDDFSVFGPSSDECLTNLAKVLARCEETNLVLNWKKCHFMVREGIVLGHKVSKDGLEVDKANVEAIEKLPPPISVKGVRSFLVHVGFYRRFIKDFSKNFSHLCRLLEKDVPFKFDDACLKVFEELKKQLVSAPIIVSPDCNEPFELMCDANDVAIGAILSQRRRKIFRSIYYTKKELLTVVWAFDIFRAYLEFDLEIRDCKGTENQVADHLSMLETRNHVAKGDVIKETFTDEQLLAVTVAEVPWYADFVNYLASGEMSPDLEHHAKKKFLRDVRSYVWDKSFLFKTFIDQLMRRCVPESEINAILHDCHASSYGGHHAGDKTAAKVLQSGFY